MKLPGYKFDTKVNGTQTTLTSKSATAKFAINLFVNVLICGDLVTTIKTATLPITPIKLIMLYAMLMEQRTPVVCNGRGLTAGQ